MNTLALQNFLNSEKFYSAQETSVVLPHIKEKSDWISANKKGLKYLNIPCAFDIETSSFFRTSGKVPEKIAIMYEWTLGLFDSIIIGRTWDEFVKVLNEIVDFFGLSENRRIVIYVHNLSFEFQFMRKWCEWSKVFAIDTRKPIYATTVSGIEFRCSYLLTGLSLEKLGENLATFKVKKLVGDLDYSKIRHSKTPLTPQELQYCCNDVKVVIAHIAECIIQEGGIDKIPITKTGYVRRFCRNSCFYDEGKSRKRANKRSRYLSLIHGLTMTVPEYKQLKRAFQGGFVHANPFHAGKILHEVEGIDFTSSYPAVMLSELFPMSSAEEVKITSKEDFEKNLRLYCCLFDAEFIGLESKVTYDSYISRSRCFGVQNAIINNGRIVSADRLITTITEQDFCIIRNFYTWQSMKIANFRRYKKDYLPTDFVKAILSLYRDKTTLKGVEGKEVEYAKSKEMLNSCYGMSVTDPARDEYIYEDDMWQDPIAPDLDEIIEKYNTSNSRFLFYPWGVWVTAYARRNLFMGICECKEDYVYSDTDSIKMLNARNHDAYVRKYNDFITKKLRRAMEYHGIESSATAPFTVTGEQKPLGVWDFEGHYSDFKTLGAKRYLVRHSQDERNKSKDRGKFKLTVAGLSKQNGLSYLLDTYGDEGVFEHFTDDMIIPAGHTGKNTHTYIDDEKMGVVYDYTGASAEFYEKSAVHLGECEYSLSLSDEYVNYLLSIEDVEM